jgi:hypothetical protein
MPGPAPVRTPMPCPGTTKSGEMCGANIGNNRAQCLLCNRFAQRLERATTRAFKQSYPKVYMKIRDHLEAKLYADVAANAHYSHRLKSQDE